MSSPRTPWRALVAIVQIALLVVLAAAGPGRHAPADRSQTGAVHAILHAGPAQTSGEDRTVAVAALVAGDSDGEQASHLGCPHGCACQAFATAPDVAPQPIRTGAGRSLSPPPAAAFASAASEALPEPPRPFA